MVVFAIICVALILGVRRLKINEDIYAIFPDSQKFTEVSEVLSKNALNRQVVFSIDAGEDEFEAGERLEALRVSLAENHSKELSDISYQSQVDEKALLNYLLEYGSMQLRDEDYIELSKKIHPDSIRRSVQHTADQLTGARLLFLKHVLAKDPLALFSGQLQQFNPSDSARQVVDGILFSSDRKKAFLFATLILDQKDTDRLENFDRALAKSLQQFNKENPECSAESFGTYQIALANAQQIKKDTKVTSVVSIVLILLLLIVHFRSPLAPLYFILPALFGALCGIGFAGYLIGSVSAVSLATASVLLGIVLDYSFHFFSHYRDSGSLSETVKTVGLPMIIGSFTTIAALGALLFTTSPVLQEFGLIALFTLFGSVLFTLLFLPVLVDLFRIKIPAEREIKFPFKVSKKASAIGLFSLFLLTVFLAYHARNVEFDADLNNLSYHPRELKDREEVFTGIQPVDEKKVYLIAGGKSEEESRQKNEKVYQLLQESKDELELTELLSLAPYKPSKSMVESKQRLWQQFWSTHADSTLFYLKLSAEENGFSRDAFHKFESWITKGPELTQEGENFARELGLLKLEYDGKDAKQYISSVVLGRDKLDELKEIVSSLPGVYLIDVSEMAENLIVQVRDDFNYLLLFSGLLVFFSLLIVYGRIELALFAFMPMVLSWIWILGISALFDIPFNFVNIMAVTFIFGLGDDFSIFTTDGLLNKYKTGKNSLSSYRGAIILSGLTTIIGTGALITAGHPAIHSISLISVVGIGSILIVSLFIQPKIFHFFVTKRVEKKRTVVTFFNLIYSFLLYLYFATGSLLLTLFMLVFVIPLPVRKTQKRKLLNYLVSKLAKSTLYAGLHNKKEVVNPEKLDFSKPRIFIANHNSFLDILMVLMLSPKMLIMVKGWVYNSPLFGLFVRYIGYPYAKEGSNSNHEEIRKLMDEGYSVTIFPEGTRSKDGKMGRFHKGAFYLAGVLGVEIHPLVILGANEVNPKNDIMINRGELYLVVDDPVTISGDSDYRALTKNMKVHMLKFYANSMKKHARLQFWHPKIIKNYIYKGPVIEWYVRVKWWLERKNFDYYDTLTGDRKRIYDLGCGLGYLSYYLHYRDPERHIIGLDYDEEKIRIAMHGICHNDHLVFQSGDIRAFQPENADVIFLNDVLHYLHPEEQEAVLKTCYQNLNNGGFIAIREGIQSEERKHRMTRLSEFLSTKALRFNKTSNELCFLKMEALQGFADKYGLRLATHTHSKTTSNRLIILYKERNEG